MVNSVTDRNLGRYGRFQINAKAGFTHVRRAAINLFEDEVSDCGFEVPIDDGDCSQIEGGVRAH